MELTERAVLSPWFEKNHFCGLGCHMGGPVEEKSKVQCVRCDKMVHSSCAAAFSTQDAKETRFYCCYDHKVSSTSQLRAYYRAWLSVSCVHIFVLQEKDSAFTVLEKMVYDNEAVVQPLATDYIDFVQRFNESNKSPLWNKATAKHEFFEDYDPNWMPNVSLALSAQQNGGGGTELFVCVYVAAIEKHDQYERAC